MRTQSRANSNPRAQACTNLKVRQLARRVTQHYDFELGKVGLKATQYSLLSQILMLGPVRPNDLASVMMLDASTLTRNLKLLIAIDPAQRT